MPNMNGMGPKKGGAASGMGKGNGMGRGNGTGNGPGSGMGRGNGLGSGMRQSRFALGDGEANAGEGIHIPKDALERRAALLRRELARTETLIRAASGTSASHVDTIKE